MVGGKKLERAFQPPLATYYRLTNPEKGFASLKKIEVQRAAFIGGVTLTAPSNQRQKKLFYHNTECC